MKSKKPSLFHFHLNSTLPSVTGSRLLLGVLSIVAGLSASSIQGYSLPTSGLVSQWRAEGNVNDSVGANHGTALNGVGYGAGIAGTAFAFDGVDDYVRVPASPSLDVGLGNGFTVGTWIKPTTLSQQNVVEWNDNAGFIGVHISLSVPAFGGGEGSLWANLVDTAGNPHQLSSLPGLITTNAFQHVALTYDKIAGAAILYLNGAVVASANVGAFIPYTSSDLYFGNRPSGPFTGLQNDGAMDETTLYNRALSGSEIATLAIVPEPTTGALLLISVLGGFWARQRLI